MSKKVAGVLYYFPALCICFPILINLIFTYQSKYDGQSFIANNLKTHSLITSKSENYRLVCAFYRLLKTRAYDWFVLNFYYDVTLSLEQV